MHICRTVLQADSTFTFLKVKRRTHTPVLVFAVMGVAYWVLSGHSWEEPIRAQRLSASIILIELVNVGASFALAITEPV